MCLIEKFVAIFISFFKSATQSNNFLFVREITGSILAMGKFLRSFSALLLENSAFIEL
jgi:hypothetical protein